MVVSSTLQKSKEIFKFNATKKKGTCPRRYHRWTTNNLTIMAAIPQRKHTHTMRFYSYLLFSFSPQLF